MSLYKNIRVNKSRSLVAGAINPVGSKNVLMVNQTKIV